MESSDTTGDTTDPPTTMNINVKFKGRTIPITLSPDSTVKDLKSLLQPVTDVLPRGQKLIFKGKLLVDEMTLTSSYVTDGDKIMLMATQGLHQGDGPIGNRAPALSDLRRTTDSNRGRWKEVKDISVEKSQVERWKAIGVIVLSGRELKAIPDEVWTCASSARVLDLSHNSIYDVPVAIGCLRSIQKLDLNSNSMSDESISWEGLASLKSLKVLSLSQNHLTTLPPALGTVSCLKQLHIAHNKLTCLPEEIGLLTQLQILKANNNRISTIPTCIGSCSSLIEVDISSNLLAELPETIGNLKDLRALYLSNNGLKTLPSTLFKMCTQLSTVDFHSTEITMDLLRQFEGWEEFDKRRLSKHQKQLDFRVEGDAAFDEGADKRGIDQASSSQMARNVLFLFLIFFFFTFERWMFNQSGLISQLFF
ncbi:LRR repeats and ubiquitin-like domain-containing protein At2g30105 isoform X2 [Cornus florida]|uniref:LRR repeats and ubiquitin-like domain-containing protein At2g30105 isoform X2 n=1 Tax=Cornus florida TaxID=4283 RepID=UPI00289E03B7|nr:LRR repeats and ubiquitin-like domain-containing protein At2g30105 isoform X2 [Cornus florida]